MRIYVASSWRNEHFKEVITKLRDKGFEVYDFAEQDSGFNWKEVDPSWTTWTPAQFIAALDHPASKRGYLRDMQALRDCDICVQVHPCGSSASLELGYAVGAQKATIAYLPGLREPELMLKLADVITDDLNIVLETCEYIRNQP